MHAVGGRRKETLRLARSAGWHARCLAYEVASVDAVDGVAYSFGREDRAAAQTIEPPDGEHVAPLDALHGFGECWALSRNSGDTRIFKHGGTAGTSIHLR